MRANKTDTCILNTANSYVIKTNFIAIVKTADSEILYLIAYEISDNTCPAERLARKRKPRDSDRNPIDINSRQIDSTSKTVKLLFILISAIELKLYLEYFAVSIMRFRNIEESRILIIFVQISASDVDKLYSPAKQIVKELVIK